MSSAPPAPPPAPAPALDRPGQAFFFVVAAGVLGHALAMSNGHQHDGAMKVLTVAIGLTLIGVVLPRIPLLARWGEQPILTVIGLGLIWQLGMLMHNPPGIYLQPRNPIQILEFFMGLSAAGVLAGAGLSEKPILGPWRMPLLIAVHFLLGCWLITASPSPIIDVDTIQRDSVRALLHGENPFELTFPNIYGNTAFFGDKIADASRINVGFPYPPLSLLLAVPGQALFGDYRYGQLAAMSGAAAFIAYARPGRVGPAAAALFLFTPRAFFVLEQGWTDPFLVLFLAATVFVALRRPGLVPYLFGLFVALKQYTVPAVIFSWMLEKRPFRWKEFGRSTLKAVAAAALVTLPFMLWNMKAFFYSVLLAHLGTPFRPDALSYPAWFGGEHQGRMPMIGLAAVAIAFGLALWRSPRTAAGFVSALVLFYLAYFSFGGHAFCNHYYFIVGALCVAAAAQKLAPDAQEPPEGDPVLALFQRLRKKSG